MAKWYYNSNTGAVNQTDQSLAWLGLHFGLGWHGPFNSKEELLTFYNTNKNANPGWRAPTSIIGAAKNLGGDAIDAVTSTVDPFKGLNLSGWFIRIAEILLGLVLIGVGAAKITGVENALSKLPKVIPV